MVTKKGARATQVKLFDSDRISADEKDGQVAKDNISTKFYEAKLAELQVELVKLQEWIRHKGLKVVVIFEGRDAAGKGGVIKRIPRA